MCSTLKVYAQCAQGMCSFELQFSLCVVYTDTSTILRHDCRHFNNPMRICTAGLCIWLRWFVYVCPYVAKNGLFGVLSLEKSPVSAIYCLLLGFNGQKGGLLHQATCYPCVCIRSRVMRSVVPLCICIYIYIYLYMYVNKKTGCLVP